MPRTFENTMRLIIATSDGNAKCEHNLITKIADLFKRRHLSAYRILQHLTLTLLHLIDCMKPDLDQFFKLQVFLLSSK